MIAGHITVKRGYWHVLLSYKDETGRRKRKSISTHLKEKKKLTGTPTLKQIDCSTAV